MCAGGGQIPLLPINSIQSSFLSLWSSLGSWNVCLAFPKTGCLLGVNQRDTHRPERPLVYLNVCLHAFLQSVYVCVHLYLCGRQSVSFFMFLYYGLQYLSCKNLKPFLTDWPTNQPQYHLATDRPTRNAVSICCQTAYASHFVVGLNRLPVELV